MKSKEQYQRDLWDKPQKEKREIKTEKIFKKIITDKIHEFINIPKARQTLKKSKTKIESYKQQEISDS